jgi:hypothetical protein
MAMRFERIPNPTRKCAVERMPGQAGPANEKKSARHN